MNSLLPVVQTNAMQVDIAQSVLLLDTLVDPGAELDYEDIESFQQPVDVHTSRSNISGADDADTAVSKPGDCLNSSPNPSIKDNVPTLRASQDVNQPAQARSNVKDIYKICEVSKEADVLDLQCKAYTFEQGQDKQINEFENDEHISSGFNYDVVTRVDKLLEEAYNILNNYQSKLDLTSRAKLLNLILALNELPHLHQSTHQENKRSVRVSDWLINHSNHPEPELCGFAERHTVHIRKFVANLKPKLSSSDTNITLGKRKRGFEDSVTDNVTSVCKSSSDTRLLVHADWSISCASAKRRKFRCD